MSINCNRAYQSNKHIGIIMSISLNLNVIADLISSCSRTRLMQNRQLRSCLETDHPLNLIITTRSISHRYSLDCCFAWPRWSQFCLFWLTTKTVRPDGLGIPPFLVLIKFFSTFHSLTTIFWKVNERRKTYNRFWETNNLGFSLIQAR